MSASPTTDCDCVDELAKQLALWKFLMDLFKLTIAEL
jgi:hypothetical protein